MKIPSIVLGALGGAAAASAMWIGVTGGPAPKASPAVDTPEQIAITPNVGAAPSAIITLPPSFSTAEKEAFRAAANADDSIVTYGYPKGVSRTATERREPTRAELKVRADLVEEQANARLEDLALRLGLTEEQQDSIFPILASASPAFHPALKPEGTKGRSISEPGAIYGDGSSIKPGSPIADIENEVYGDLDEVQQAALEEQAMDREAWWEDIVGMLEDDLESSTNGGELVAREVETPSENKFTEEQRDEAATTNENNDFSDLLFGN